MSNSDLLLKRGNLLRNIARVLGYIFLAGVALFVIYGIIFFAGHDITSGWYWGLFFGEVVTLISFILAGVGLLSIPVYLKALTLLGLGQIAKNTDKA